MNSMNIISNILKINIHMIDNMLDKTTDWLLNKKPEIEWNDKLNDNSNIIELHDNNIHVVKTEQLRNYLIYIQL